MKPRKPKVVPIREGVPALTSFLRAHQYGGVRERVYTGQPWTFLGKRGQRPVVATYRDVGDALHRALSNAAHTYAPQLQTIDFTAIVGEALLVVEEDGGDVPPDLALDAEGARVSLGPEPLRLSGLGPSMEAVAARMGIGKRKLAKLRALFGLAKEPS